MNRIYCPQNGWKEGDKIGIVQISFFQQWEIKGVVDKKEKEYWSKKVYKYIYEMITKDVKLSEIIIQGKTETGYRPVNGVGIVLIGIKGSFDIIQESFFKCILELSLIVCSSSKCHEQSKELPYIEKIIIAKVTIAKTTLRQLEIDSSPYGSIDWYNCCISLSDGL